MSTKQFDENKYKRGWQKENMAQVTVKYKTEFVEEFKQACNKLGITQSAVIRKAMEGTIMEAEKVKPICIKSEETV